MGNEDGRADGVVTAASRVRPINAYDNRNTELVQFSIAEERRTTATAVRINLFLFVELNARAIQDIDKRDAQGLCRVRSTEQAFGLARYPGTGKLLVVRSNDNSPLAVNAAQALDNADGTVLVAFGIVQGIERSESARFNQFFNALQCSQLTGFIQGFIAAASRLGGFDEFVDLGFDGFQLSFVFRIRFLHRFADLRHMFKITGHRVKTHVFRSSYLSLIWLPAQAL